MGIINNIRKIREEKGFSQDYMASSLGIAVKTYAKLENGQGKLIVKIIDDLSRILEVSPYELIKFEEYGSENGVHPYTVDIWNNFYNEQRETIITLHKERIKHLEAEIIYLRHILEKKVDQDKQLVSETSN
jgi:transcriptional regulator with XRE-family HTH domain